MSEVTTPPPSHEMFVKSGFGDLQIAEFSEAQLKELSLTEVRGIIKGSITRQLKMAIGDPEMEMAIKNVAKTTFGPLLYPDNVLGERREVKDLEVSAKLQHNLAHSIFFAGRGESDPQFTETIYSLVRTLEILTSRPESEFDSLKRCWMGTKSELAAIKVLKDQGFKVHLPNYTSQSRETFLMDVAGGIDMMAFSPKIPNGVLSLDIKSNGFNTKAPALIHEITTDSERYKKWDPSVREKLKGQTNRTIYETILFIPNHSGAFMGLNPDIEDHREALRNFGFIHPNYESAIIRQLSSVGKANNERS